MVRYEDTAIETERLRLPLGPAMTGFARYAELFIERDPSLPTLLRTRCSPDAPRQHVAADVVAVLTAAGGPGRISLQHDQS